MEKEITTNDIIAMLREAGQDANFAFGYAWGKLSDEQRSDMVRGINEFVARAKEHRN
jgi:hypothetical protein